MIARRALWEQRHLSEVVVHPIVLSLVALLVALAVVSMWVFHRRARSALADHDPLLVDSEALLIEGVSAAAR